MDKTVQNQQQAHQNPSFDQRKKLQSMLSKLVTPVGKVMIT
jgi:hypothetical protein